MRLPFRLLLLLLCPAALLPAQLTFDTPAPASSTGPVLNKPYTAEKHEHTERRLADGTLSTGDFNETEVRDAAGVIAVVSHQTAAGGAEQHVPVEVHLVVDMSARTVLQWTNAARVATLIRMPPVPAHLDAAQPAKPENLGHRVIHGYAATGTRTETQVAGQAAGSATPLRTITTLWKSDALQMALESTSTSPQNGTTTSVLMDLKPGAPDAALFHAPAGYTVREVGPNPPGGIAATPPPLPDEAHLPAMSYDDAMNNLNDEGSAPLAAAVLMKLEKTDTDLQRKDKTIYAVARKRLDLGAAESLARADVLEGEQALVAVPKLPTSSSLRAEHQLARYWDTLGYILDREGKEGTRYLLAAWTVDPLAYYGSHLGHDYEQARMSNEAIAVYRQAALADGSPEMKQTVRDRLNALAGPTPSTAAAAAPALPRAVASILYVPGKQPDVVFLSGESQVGASGASAAASAAKAWSLPDAGPEQIVRLVAITCSSGAACSSTNLPAHEP